jgi:hypothetical protein
MFNECSYSSKLIDAALFFFVSVASPPPHAAAFPLAVAASSTPLLHVHTAQAAHPPPAYAHNFIEVAASYCCCYCAFSCYLQLRGLLLLLLILMLLLLLLFFLLFGTVLLLLLLFFLLSCYRIRLLLYRYCLTAMWSIRYSFFFLHLYGFE